MGSAVKQSENGRYSVCEGIPAFCKVTYGPCGENYTIFSSEKNLMPHVFHSVLIVYKILCET